MCLRQDRDNELWLRIDQALRENKCIAFDLRAFRARTGRDPWDRRCPIDCPAQIAGRRTGCPGCDPNACD